MAGLFFWRKKREAPAIAGDEASSYDDSQESVAETTTGVDELEVLTAAAPVEPEKPKDKKPKFFKPKAKPIAEPVVSECRCVCRAFAGRQTALATQTTRLFAVGRAHAGHEWLGLV